MSVIVGIDPSLSCTAAIAGDETQFVNRTFRSNYKAMNKTAYWRQVAYDDRCGKIMSFLESFARIDAIYIEDYAISQHQGSSIVTAEFGSILRMHLLDIVQDGSCLHEVKPSTLKKFATGKGNADKSVVSAALARRYDVELSSNDEFDALAAFKLGLVCERMVRPDNAKQREAAETVLGEPLDISPQSKTAETAKPF